MWTRAGRGGGEVPAAPAGSVAAHSSSHRRGGVAVLWFHFMRGAELTAVGRPNKAKDLLEVGELRQVFESEPGWDIVIDDAVTLPDGRPVSEFVAVRDSAD